MFEFFNEVEDNFNLNPFEIYEKLHKTSPENIQEAMADLQVLDILDKSKNFVLKWIKRFTQIFCTELELPYFFFFNLNKNNFFLENLLFIFCDRVVFYYRKNLI